MAIATEIDSGESGGSPGVPRLAFSAFENEDIELVDLNQQRAESEGEFAGKSREEILQEARQLKEMLASQATAETAPKTPASQPTSFTLDQLKALAEMNQRQQQVQAPMESEEAFAERIKQKFFDDPSGALDEAIARKTAPVMQQLGANNLYWSKKSLEADPALAETYKTYEGEVEAEVRRMPPQDQTYNPKVYVDAAQRVAARHINEIIEARVKDLLEKQTGKTKASPGSTPPTFSETGMSLPGSASRPASRKVQVALDDSDKQRAAAIGMSLKDFAARKARKEGKI